jgi:hypothetical protein
MARIDTFLFARLVITDLGDDLVITHIHDQCSGRLAPGLKAQPFDIELMSLRHIAHRKCEMKDVVIHDPTFGRLTSVKVIKGYEAIVQ